MNVSANPTIGLLREIADKAARGEPLAIVRVLRKPPNPSTTMSVYDGELEPRVDDQHLTERIFTTVGEMIEKGTAAELLACADEEGSPAILAIEMIRPKLELLVFGGGHVGQAVALIGALTGYNVTVVDDRKEFASRQRLPDPRIELVVSDYATIEGKVAISPQTAVVIVTRGHQYDELCLKNTINSQARYIGMIGSRRRVVSVFKKLVSEGYKEAALQRVHAPIGLRIGARSPQEIAIAILAEIIGHVNNPAYRKEEK